MNANYSECHYCMSVTKSSDDTFYAKCCIKRCSKQYCISCIKKYFDPNYQITMYKEDTWICFFCQKKCQCSKCVAPTKPALQKKVSTKKASTHPSNFLNQHKIAVEQSLENSIEISGNSYRISENSVNSPNVSLNYQLNYNHPQLQNQKIKNGSQSFDINILSDEQLKKLPPFMRKIMERKNNFYSFILQKMNNSKHNPIIQQNETIEVKKIHKNEIKIEEEIKSEQRSAISYQNIKLKEIISKQLLQRQNDDQGFQIIE